LVALLVAGGAAGVLTVSLSCPLPLRRTHPSTIVCCFYVFAAMGVTSTKSGRLEVNLSLSEKRGGKSHLGTIYFRLTNCFTSRKKAQSERRLLLKFYCFHPTEKCPPFQESS